MSHDHVLSDEPRISSGDSTILQRSPAVRNILNVYEAGETTVVGFGGREVPDETCLAEYREQLAELTERHCCHTLTVDLTGVKRVPSGLLGLLVSIQRRGLRIELFNPSKDIRDVLETTRLATLFDVREAAT